MNRSMAKLLRKIATQKGVLNKKLYKELKKHTRSGDHARLITKTFLENINKEKQDEANTN